MEQAILSNNLITEFIKIIPAVLWVVVALVFLIMFYRPIRYQLIPNLTGFKALGLELSFITKSINAALDLAEKNPKWDVEIPLSSKENVLNRAKKHLHIFDGAKILWVDDVPLNNKNELKMFRQLSVKIKFAKDTATGLKRLKSKKYDLVISDMSRGNHEDNGMVTLKEFKKYNPNIPVIFYIGAYDPTKGTPAGAFGLTNRPDLLLHLVLDALERRKY